MDRARIELEDLRYRSDAVFYYRGWGREGDIAVAAHAEADAQSPIVGLAWVRLANIDDVVGKADERVGEDFAAALDKTGNEVVRSEVVPEDAADEVEHDSRAVKGADYAESAGESPAVGGADEGTASTTAADLTPTDDQMPFTGYGWVAADIPELDGSAARPPGAGNRRRPSRHGLCSGADERLPAVSLSVEDGNGAAKLYADHGFVSVGRNGDSDVLVRKLG